MKFDFISGISFIGIQKRLCSFYERESEFMQLRENKLLKQLDNWVIYEILKSMEQSDSRFSCDVTKSRSTSEGVNLYHLCSDKEVIKSEFGYIFL